MSEDTIISARYSVRAYLDRPVAKADIEALLNDAARAPSGGNVQPWHVFVTAGKDRDAFLSKAQEAMRAQPMGEPDIEDIYPKGLTDPYRARRAECGADMYGALGIAKDDKMAGLMQVMKNYELFGAPVGIFFAIDRQMGRNQWAHLGMYMQSVMILAAQRGLGTCPQEAWMRYPNLVRDHFDIPENLDVYCGMALGYPDLAHPINNYRTSRAPLSEFATFRGT